MLQNVERAEDHRDEFTVIYTAGQGVGDTRMLVTLTDADRVNGSPFNRREQFVDARYIPTEQGLSTEADAALWRGRPAQVFSGVLPSHVYGRRVRWGDRTTAELDGEVVDCVLHGVEVELQDGEEVIRVDLRSDGADAEDAVRRIEGAIDAGGGSDAPLFTVTPSPDAVPLADADGHIDIGWLDLADLVVDWSAVQNKPVTATPTADSVPLSGGSGTIADGWLSAAIARISQIPTSLPPSGAADGDLYNDYPSPNVKAIHGFEFEDPNLYGQPDQGAVYVYDQIWPGWLLSDVTGIKGVSYTPGAYTVLSANNLGKIADSYLSSAIARLTDITWSNVSGKPSTFAPSTHTHIKAAITDLETITATPADSAVPKAGAGGTIADGWLSAAISRITSIGLAAPSQFVVSGSPLTANGTLTLAWANQSVNTVLAGPASGGVGAPGFRSLVAADIPNLDAAKIATGLLAVARGGTGVSAQPAFLVHKNGVNQTGIANNTPTQISWSTEVFDTNNNFASGRFTPTVAGKYLFIFVLSWVSTANQTYIAPRLYKNGLFVAQYAGVANGTITQPGTLITIQDANGTTDFFETYGYQNSGSARDVYGDATSTFFAGVRIA
jgi:hypothetical protein